MEDAWAALACPGTGGKRSRSPVEKLADLQGQDAEDEANWRSSKRYFTEVISSGFSKLTFGRGLQQGGADEQQQQAAQMLNVTSPRAQAGVNGCYIQLPGCLLSPRDDSACDMDMQESPTMRQQSPSSNRMHRAPSLTETFAAPAGSPMCSPAGSGSQSPVQYPFGSYPSPSASNKALPPPAWHIAAGTMAAAAAAAAPGPPALPKALKAADKPPNSPSDLPTAGSNLRKVALLRSLLVRTEQHLQQHLQEQQPTPQQTEQQQLQTPSAQQHPQQQQLQQYEQGQLLPAMPADTAAAADAAEQATVLVQQREYSCQLLGAARPGSHHNSACTAAGTSAAGQATAATHSDDMECSTSSLGDSSDSSDVQPSRQAAADDADLAASSLLCTEVLPFNNVSHSLSCKQQRQRCTQHLHHMPFAGQQHLQQQIWGPGLPSGHVGVFAAHPQQQQQQHQSMPGSLGAAQWSMQQQVQQQQQQQQQQGKPPTALELLSKERLEKLRAKALASTSTLTDLEPEDLHSLQLSITASKSRRATVDHTPSHLQSGQAEARRHSSHI